MDIRHFEQLIADRHDNQSINLSGADDVMLSPTDLDVMQCAISRIKCITDTLHDILDESEISEYALRIGATQILYNLILFSQRFGYSLETLMEYIMEELSND